MPILFLRKSILAAPVKPGQTDVLHRDAERRADGDAVMRSMRSMHFDGLAQSLARAPIQGFGTPSQTLGGARFVDYGDEAGPGVLGRLRGIAKAQHAKHEVAAFKLSNILGWHLVPPTVLRGDLDFVFSPFHKRGQEDPDKAQAERELHERQKREYATFPFHSIQHLVNGLSEKDNRCLLEINAAHKEPRINPIDRHKLDLFDALTCNNDRANNTGNIYYATRKTPSPGGATHRLVAIDNGLGFDGTTTGGTLHGLREETNFRREAEFDWDYAMRIGKDHAQQWVEDLKNLNQNRAAASEQLAPFLNPAQIDALFARNQSLLRDV